ncbi:MAG: hypothetical protein ACU843_03135 [Gammaproteobacteria bacterium]
MTIRIMFISIWIFAVLLGGCSRETDQGLGEQESAVQSASLEDLALFNGVWEVTGRTGNEDGTNEPVCGYETGLGTITIEGSKINGQVTNKSGFEYTVEGTIDRSGEIKATLLYQGYDAAELFGTFSAETGLAKGNWKDAVNACPGVWKATRTAGTETAEPSTPEEIPKSADPEPGQATKSG